MRNKEGILGKGRLRTDVFKLLFFNRVNLIMERRACGY